LLTASLGSGYESPLDGGYQVIIRKAWPWTMVGNVFWQCHASCSLNTSFVDFERENAHCSHYKRLTDWSLPKSTMISSGSRKPLHRMGNPFFFSIWILYITEHVLVLNIAEILLGLKQSPINPILMIDIITNHTSAKLL